MPHPIGGYGTQVTNTPRSFLLSPDTANWEVGVTVSSAARDSANTPTTTLRAGLVMGIITSSKKFAQYDNSASDGSEVARGILKHQVKLLDDEGTATDGDGVLVLSAFVDEDQLIGLDSAGRSDLAHILFNDEVHTGS